MKTGMAQILVALVGIVLLAIVIGVIKIPIVGDRVIVMCNPIFEEWEGEYLYSQIPNFCNDESIAEFDALQTEVYDCMVQTFGFTPITYVKQGEFLVPSNVVNYIISDYNYFLYGVTEDFTHKYYVDGFTIYNKLEIHYKGFPSSVRKSDGMIDEILAEEHEMSHLFIQNGLDVYPGEWYTEGAAVYLSSRLDCSDKAIPGDSRFELAGEQYERGVMGLPFERSRLLFGGFALDPYIQGSMFFIGLERDYGCGVDCVIEIVNTVRDKYQLDIESYTAEEYQRLIVSPSLPFIPPNDLKMTIESVVGQDLTELYDLLEIERSP